MDGASPDTDPEHDMWVPKDASIYYYTSKSYWGEWSCYIPSLQIHHWITTPPKCGVTNNLSSPMATSSRYFKVRTWLPTGGYCRHEKDQESLGLGNAMNLYFFNQKHSILELWGWLAGKMVGWNQVLNSINHTMLITVWLTLLLQCSCWLTEQGNLDSSAFLFTRNGPGKRHRLTKDFEYRSSGMYQRSDSSWLRDYPVHVHSLFTFFKSEEQETWVRN